MDALGPHPKRHTRSAVLNGLLKAVKQSTFHEESQDGSDGLVTQRDMEELVDIQTHLVTTSDAFESVLYEVGEVGVHNGLPDHGHLPVSKG